MKSKIELFQEIVAQDPTSKIFYPLAKLYAEAGMAEQAAETLTQGLTRHPDHLEARLLLVQTLADLGRRSQGLEEVQSLVKILSAYPAFWDLWSEMNAVAAPDAALALSFLRSHVRGEEISWSEVIEKGLLALSRERTGAGLESVSAKAPASGAAAEAATPAEPEAASKSFEAELGELDEETGEDEEPQEESGDSLRTRTMAELLVSQEDYDQAVDIYEELAEHAGRVGNDALRDELLSRLDEVRAMKEGGKPSKGARPQEPDFSGVLDRAKGKLVDTLSALADRLEARANL